VVSESYILYGMELNWDKPLDRSADDNQHSLSWMKDFADRIYTVQEARFRHIGILTARTEHQLAGDPYFVYDTIYSDGYPWNTITETGRYVPEVAAVSGKAAMGLWVLWPGSYTDRLFAVVQSLASERGFYEGQFESGGKPIPTYTANNNGIILEALLYKEQGKLLKWGTGKEQDWTKLVSNIEQARAQGFPNVPRPRPLHPQLQ
jgi:hypothetical protein